MRPESEPWTSASDPAIATGWGRVGPRLCWGKGTRSDFHLWYDLGIVDCQVGRYYLSVTVRR